MKYQTVFITFLLSMLFFAPVSGESVVLERGAAVTLDKVGTGNNTGQVGIAWRWNEGLRGLLAYDSTLQLPLNGPWDRYVDATIPVSRSDKSLALVVIFRKTGTGNVALGFARDISWDNGPSPQRQTLLKIKECDILTSQDHIPTGTDQDTDIDLIPDQPQGLMIKIASDGAVQCFYQDGSDKDIDSSAWQNITPSSASTEEVMRFDATLERIGINGFAGSSGMMHVDYIGLFETHPAPRVILEDDFEDRPPSPLDSVVKNILDLIGDHTDEEFYDSTLPTEIPVKPYEGQRYEAEIPDTLDLAHHAALAINAATRLVSPDCYAVYQVLQYIKNPSTYELRDGSLLNITPKYLEALPMLRVMSGSTFNIDVDGKMMAAIVRVTGTDGLCYQPVRDRPWAFYDDFNRRVGRPFCDLFGEGRQLLTYSVWYQHDKNPLWRKLAQKKIVRLLEISTPRGDTVYFQSGRGGLSPWAKGWTRNPGDPMVACCDVGYSFSMEMTGGPATYVTGFIPQAASQWNRLTGNPDAFKLAHGLACYLESYGKMLEDHTGRFLVGHSTHVTHSLIANLAYALAAQDQQMIKWVRDGAEYWLKWRDPGRTGIYLSFPAGEIGDMTQVLALLSLSGIANHWEDLDRLVRNSLLPMQVTETDVIRAKSLPKQRLADLGDDWAKLSPIAPVSREGFHQPDDGIDRGLGGFFATLDNFSCGNGDGNGNCWRALYYAWDSIMQSHGRTLKINLLLNRASPWADIDSYIPCEGKVVVKMKTNRDRILIRIPEWTDWNQVSCTINQEDRQYQWITHGYIDLGKVKAGDEIVVEFPMKQWVVSTNLPVSKLITETAKLRCQITLKGNTVVGASTDIMYPMHKQEKYRADKAPLKKVTRFVSDEQFIW